MRNLLILILLGMIFCGYAALPAKSPAVKFENRLSRCMSINLKDISTVSNIVLAKTIVTLHHSTGDCGCKSALVSYSSGVYEYGYSYDGGVKEEHREKNVLQSGLINLMEGGEKTLVLATEPNLFEKKLVNVELSCAPNL